MPRFDIQPLAAAHLPALRELFEITFGRVISEATASWRYLQAGEPIPGLVAFDGGRLAASYTMWPANLDIGGEVVRGAQSMDTMTHPDYRGKGLFVQLAQTCYEHAAGAGYEVVYGFPNANSYPGFLNLLNWDHTGDIAYWKRLITPVPQGPLGAASRTLWSLAYRPSSPDNFVITEEEVSADNISALAASREADGKDRRCRIERNSSWLRWRYAPESELAYRSLTARRDGTLEAVVVWRREADRFLVAEALGKTEALTAAIGSLVRHAQEMRLAVVVAFSSDPAVIPSLKANGFWARGSVPLIVRSFTTRLLRANIHHHPAWVINGGDFDVF